LNVSFKERKALANSAPFVVEIAIQVSFNEDRFLLRSIEDDCKDRSGSIAHPPWGLSCKK
jgi:hypothetical protein